MKNPVLLSTLLAAFFVAAPSAVLAKDKHKHRDCDDRHRHHHYSSRYYCPPSVSYRSYRPYYYSSYPVYYSTSPYYYGGYYPYSYYSRPTLSLSFSTSPSYSRSVSRVTDYDDDLAVDVQRALARRGYYRGEIDGDIGPGTRSAIRKYQYDRRLEVTGRIDRSLLRSLGVS